jgi:hypothetical protein
MVAHYHKHSIGRICLWAVKKPATCSLRLEVGAVPFSRNIGSMDVERTFIEKTPSKNVANRPPISRYCTCFRYNLRNIFVAVKT